MADGTRWKLMEDAVKANENRFNNLHKTVQDNHSTILEVCASLQQRMDGELSSVKEFMEGVKATLEGILKEKGKGGDTNESSNHANGGRVQLGVFNPERSEAERRGPRPTGAASPIVTTAPLAVTPQIPVSSLPFIFTVPTPPPQQPFLATPYTYQPFQYRPKIDFPHFGGVNPHDWISKCNQFFLLHPMDDYQKVVIASIHLDGEASTWLRAFQSGRPPVMWTELVGEICGRFGLMPHENVLWAFKAVCQLTTVKEYQGRFETLKGRMLLHNPLLPEMYFINFVGGLREDIRKMVQAAFATNLNQACGLARLHEATLDIISRQNQPTLKASPTYRSTPPPSLQLTAAPAQSHTPSVGSSPNTTNTISKKIKPAPTMKRLTQAEMQT